MKMEIELSRRHGISFQIDDSSGNMNCNVYLCMVRNTHMRCDVRHARERHDAGYAVPLVTGVVFPDPDDVYVDDDDGTVGVVSNLG